MVLRFPWLTYSFGKRNIPTKSNNPYSVRYVGSYLHREYSLQMHMRRCRMGSKHSICELSVLSGWMKKCREGSIHQVSSTISVCSPSLCSGLPWYRFLQFYLSILDIYIYHTVDRTALRLLEPNFWGSRQLPRCYPKRQLNGFALAPLWRWQLEPVWCHSRLYAFS